MIADIQHIATLIPARDEETLIPACIESVLHAQAKLPSNITADIIVVVDSSVDATYDIATRMLGERGMVWKTGARNVGIARKLAADIALGRYAGAHHNCWLANTDADCQVPEGWLLDQIAFAAAGMEAVAGVVDVVDFSEHHQGVAQRFRETYLIHPDGTHPHVHGANLGMRADTYLGIGGWAGLQTAEDHDLWNRLSTVGWRRQSVSQLKVVTSGRRIGRAPSGFASALAAHNEAFA